MGEEYNKIKALLSDVIAGDEEAEKTLNLRPIKISVDKTRITWMSLQLSQKQNSEIAAAAKAINFPMLEACAKANVAFASMMYKCITKTELAPEVVEPQDYSQTVLALLKEIEDSIGMKKVWSRNATTDVSADDQESIDDAADAGACKSRDVQDVSAGGKASTGGHVVSDRGSDDDVQDIKMVIVKAQWDEEIDTKGGDGVGNSGGSAKDEPEGGDGVSAGGVEGDGKAGDGVIAGCIESDDKAEDDVPKAALGDTLEPLYRDAKSKNKRRPCPYCDFFGIHLKRHLQSMHGKDVTSKVEEMRLVYRADVKEKRKRGEKTTIKNKHEHIYQCGIPGCHKIVSRMSQHLKRFHKITNPNTLAVAQQKFTRLTGQRSRRPTSTQTAKPKPASMARKDPNSPERKKRAAHDTSHDPTPAPKAKKDPRSPKGKKQAADDSSDVIPPTPKRKRQVEEKDDADDASDIVRPTRKRRRYVEEEVGEETTTDEDAHSVADDSDDDLSSSSDISNSHNQCWKEYYLNTKKRDQTIRGHFISTFYRYLLHVERGAHSEEQAMIHSREVHQVLEILDKDGEDLDCLIWKDSLDIWDVFAGPRLKNKELKGETLKVYMRSLEFFAKFIKKNLFFNKDLLSNEKKSAIINLLDRLPDYRATIRRRTATQSTTRKVEEAYAKLTAENIRQYQTSEVSKKAVKLLGEAINFRPLTKNEFVVVRDYPLVTTLCENASRPGPLETAKVDRFYKAVYTESTKKWTVLVDEHKTTRHQGPAELVMDNHLYGYVKLYAEYIRPVFAAAGVDELSIKDDGEAFRKGTIGRRVMETFRAAGVREDIRVSATNIRKLYSSAAQELSPTKKRLINAHMKHKESTADSNYVIKVNAERSGRAHELIKNIISEKQPDELDNDIWRPKGDSAKRAIAKESIAKEVSDKEVSAEKESDKESDDEAANQSRNKAPSAPLQQPPQEVAEIQLSNDDKVVLLSVFNHHIQKGQLLVVEEIKAICRADNHLKKLILDPRKVKKACDIFRYKTNVVRRPS